MRFHVHSFGCRASQADGAAIESALEARGFAGTRDAATADLVVLNTCSVTASADQEVRYTVAKLQRSNPAARVVVTGCYAQRAPEEIAAIPGVSMVIGNSHKGQLAALVTEPESLEFHGRIHVGDIFAQQDFVIAPVDDAGADRTRPNLKIQDGCNNRCSFCIIPSVRGRSRSAPADLVIAEVRRLAAKHREIVLSGINLGRWGREQGSPYAGLRLAGLIRRILDETDVERLRISSVEPMDWSEELLGLLAESPRIAPHIHAPLQSGCDAVLRRMYRKYRVRHYEDRIRKARTLMPQAAIGADVMTGFPGETDAEFEESRRFIESLPFTYLHVFTYSERPGTPAPESGAPVPMRVRRDRNQILRELAAARNLAFRQSQVGRRLQVITLATGLIGLSGNFLNVGLAGRHERNEMIDVEVGAVTPDGLAERTLLPVLG